LTGTEERCKIKPDEVRGAKMPPELRAVILFCGREPDNGTA
jgi:hypothetical protein